MATPQRNTTTVSTFDGWPAPRPFIILCPRPGCLFTASALSEGRADRAIAAHIIAAHLAQEQAS